MDSLNYIGERVSSNNPKSIVRSAFTYFWAKYISTLEKKISISEDYSAAIDDGAFVVKLMYQAGAGSIRELTEQYFSGPELHKETIELLSKSALDKSEKVLSAFLSDLSSELAELLLVFITLIDEKSEHLKFSFLKKINPFKYKFINKEHKENLLLKAEINEMVLRAKEELLAPIVKQECGLQVRKKDKFFWVENHNTPIKMDDVKIIHCDQYAGMCNVGAYTAMEALSKACSSAKNQFMEFNTIFLMDEMIELNSDTIAYFPVERNKKDLLSSAIAVLNKRLALKPEERSDLFRRWTEQFFLLHEMGHLKTDTQITQAIREKPILENLFYFDENATQLYADAYALKQLETKDDELLRLFLIIKFIDKDWLQWAEEFKTEKLILTHSILFMLRALLLEKTPSACLYELLNNMEEILGNQGQRIYRKWLRQKVIETKDEVLAELGKKFDL